MELIYKERKFLCYKLDHGTVEGSASLLGHKGTSKIGAIIQWINSIKGPAGSNSFILVDKDASNAAKPFFLSWWSCT